MQVRIFTLRFNPATDRFEDEDVNAFLADKDVASIHDHFFLYDDIPYLTLVVCYRASALPAPPPQQAKPEQKRDESWRETLSEADWPLFNTLRTWRSDQAKQEGIPPYVIANNRQLAQIVSARPQTLAALGQLEGFGEAKLKKYGKDLLGFIAGSTKPPKLSGKEDGEKT
ncbi:MAG: HRDC domain-containing protein [Candidatus Competibacteraceae bacterium]|nr:HRDC domain-containing protein [Candidatus Competibacteraceae bacterium]MCB1813028.1 HRDC domain-containing protein [Candidatus Competibacteraceae bacterium]